MRPPWEVAACVGLSLCVGKREAREEGELIKKTSFWLGERRGTLVPSVVPRQHQLPCESLLTASDLCFTCVLYCPVLLKRLPGSQSMLGQSLQATRISKTRTSAFGGLAWALAERPTEFIALWMHDVPGSCGGKVVGFTQFPPTGSCLVGMPIFIAHQPCDPWQVRGPL